MYNKRSIQRSLLEKSGFVYIKNITGFILSVKTSNVFYLLNSIKVLNSYKASFFKSDIFFNLKSCFKPFKLFI